MRGMNGNLLNVEDNTGWQAALEIARETENTVQALCTAVLSDDIETAKVLAKELRGNGECDQVAPKTRNKKR